MGLFDSLTGLGGGGNSGGAGLGFGATGTTIAQPTTVGQATDAYNSAQQGLNNQAAFLTALQGQNGIGNQSAAYNQFGNIAAGQGPNPAQAMLSQQTGQNVANQAALMAGQRGASSNVGLMARQAAQQGAATQQQAVGQGATMQAQQSLAALQAQAGIAGQQVGQQAAATGAYTGATQGEQQQLLNSIAAQNQASVGMQSNINNANAGVSQVAAQGQQNMMGNLVGSMGSAMSMMARGGTVKKMADGGDTSDSSAGYYQAPSIAPPAAPTVSGASAASSRAMSQLGQSMQNAQNPNGKKLQGSALTGATIGNGVGNGLKSLFGSSSGSSSGADPSQPDVVGQGAASAMSNAPAQSGPDALSDSITTLAADGGIMQSVMKLAPLALMALNQGGKIDSGSKLKSGGGVPGKAKVKGDSLKNDNVKALLSPGEIVIPRSIATHPNAPQEAAKFVAACLAKSKLK